MVRVLGWSALAALVGCGGAKDHSSASDGGYSGTDAPFTTGTTEGDADADADSDADSDADGDDDTDAPAADTLTAGAWDDNRNFSWFEGYVADMGAVPDAPSLTVEEQVDASVAFGGDRPARERLDVAILLDTTGSMKDELAWLTTEIGAVADRIAATAPDADVRWALVVYRDHGDAYVTDGSGFTADLDAFQDYVADQSAAGGGDWPEAVEEGLRDTLDLDWRTEPDVARVAFWIADAPAHEEHVPVVEGQIREARDRDIHLYPVAASGTTPSMELTMRVAAQLTGGRYLFLTDDSGVGNPHAEPTIPCYFVTLLSDAVVRMVEIELTGQYREPAPEEILRTGGDPVNGACTLDDGGIVIAF